MNCVKCGYLLFGLSNNRCPECGNTFDTTDYCFPSTSVHFLCPHCGQNYLGTDRYGLPYPRLFRCINCDKPLSAARMPVHPRRDDVVGEPLRYGTPWDHRDRIGSLRGFVNALTQVPTQPGSFFRTAYFNDRDAAITFGLIAALLASAFWFGVLWLINAIAPIPGLPGPGILRDVRFLLVWPVGFLAATLIVGYLFAVTTCVILRITGSQANLDDCVQVVFYANAVLPAMIVPPVGVVWHIIVLAGGLRETFGLSPRRAMMAAIMPILIIGNATAAAMIL